MNNPPPPAPAAPSPEVTEPRSRRPRPPRVFKDRPENIPPVQTYPANPQQSPNPAVNIANRAGGMIGISPNSRRAPFPSNYSYILDHGKGDLTGRQREDMLDNLADQWLRNLKNSSGWDRTASEEEYIFTGSGADPLRIEEERLTHFEKRAIYMAASKNEWHWRKWFYGDNSAYSKSNLVAPLCRRVSTAMAARGIRYFFGSSPYFFCEPLNQKTDTGLAEALQKVGEAKLHKSQSAQELRSSIQRAFDLGECVLKVAHEKRQSLSKKFDTVMATAAGPVFKANGDYITKKDRLSVDPMTGITTLASDGTLIPPGFGWASGIIARKTVHYEGPKITEIPYRNFLCPLNFKSVQEAPVCVHLFQASPVDIVSMFTDTQTGAQIIQAVDLMRQISGIDMVQSYDPNAPNGNNTGLLDVEEFWMRNDADGDNVMEDVCYVRVGLPGGPRFPLFYEYTENMTETHERPFYPVRAVPRNNSWTGVGAIELFIEHQNIVDLMLNRWSYSVSSSGYVTIWDPSAFEETDGEQPDLELDDGKSYRLRSGRDAQKALQRIYLQDNIGEHWKEIMEFFLQLAVNESGVLTANDGATAGLQSSELATGLNQINDAGQELFGVYVSCLEGGITPAIDAFIHTLYGRLTTREVARTTKKGVPGQLAVEPRDVEGMDFDVSVAISRFKADKTIQAISTLLGPNPVATYFTVIPIPDRPACGVLLRQLLVALDVEDVPDIIQNPPSAVDPAAYQAAVETYSTLDPSQQTAMAVAMTALSQQTAVAAQQQQQAQGLEAAGSGQPVTVPGPTAQPAPAAAA